MSFPRYPKYKPSGVDWLGEVPNDWGISKFRHIFTESPEKIEGTVVGEMLSVSGYRGIEVKEYDDENRRRIDSELLGYRIVRKGQLVVNTMWLNYAGLGVSNFEGHVSPAYRSYWIAPDLSKNFIHYLMRSGIYVGGYTKYLTGIRPNSLQMSRDDLMTFPILLPGLSEQQSIASFLDHETARIDALIAEQQRLIELLKEKRQAVIAHAVTKGLNPHVRMKDSGVEWLGEVPEHWEVLKLGHVAKLIGGYAFSAYDFSDEGLPLVRMNNLRRGKLDLDDSVKIPYSVINDRANLKAGDLLWGMSGSIGESGSLGNYAKVRNIDLPCLLNQRVGKFVPNQLRVLVDFLELIIQAHYFYEQVTLLVTGTAQFNISSEQVQSCIIALPNISDQKNIITFVTENQAKLAKLIEQADQAITLLQERRTALISAAVTGQIDVRSFQPVAV